MKRINDDWWPDRDNVCHRVCYDLVGAALASAYCPKHDLVIQAGGNVGVWPRYLKSLFANVWTFEPSRENYELMQKNLSGVDVRTWNAALGRATGTCSMSFNPENCGDDRTQVGEGTEVVSIDSLGVNPDLIYLDVQGDELSVLEGARDTLERSKPIVAIEWDNELVRLRGDPIGLLLSFGYLECERYGQDRIFSTRVEDKPTEPSVFGLIRVYPTKHAALVAIKNPPPGVQVDLAKMAWRHPNGTKTHFKVDRGE